MPPPGVLCLWQPVWQDRAALQVLSQLALVLRGGSQQPCWEESAEVEDAVGLTSRPSCPLPLSLT